MTLQPQQQHTSDSPHKPHRLAILTGIVLLLFLVYLLRQILLPFVFAAAVAFMADPAVRWISRKMGTPRWVSGVIVFFAIAAALAGIAFWAQDVFVPQLISLLSDAPSLVHALFQKIFGGQQFSLFGRSIDANAIVQDAANNLSNLVNGPAGMVAGTIAMIVMFFLTLILLLFFLISGPQIAEGTFWLVPPTVRPRVVHLAHRMYPVLYRYIGGVFVVVASTAFLCWVGTRLVLGMSHAVVLSILVGLLEAIPVVGPTISVILLATVAVATGKLWIIIGVSIFALALRLLVDQLLGPLIIGRAVKLHPAVVIFSFLVGGTIFGVLGVLVAIPAAATIKIALQMAYDDSVS